MFFLTTKQVQNDSSSNSTSRKLKLHLQDEGGARLYDEIIVSPRGFGSLINMFQHEQGVTLTLGLKKEIQHFLRQEEYS